MNLLNLTADNVIYPSVNLTFLNNPAEKRAVFLKSLDDVIGEEKGMITLACEASKPRVSPTWRKDGKVLKAGPKYELLHTGKSLGLIIKDVTKEDAGEYSCDLGTEVSKSKVTVRGEYLYHFVHVVLFRQTETVNNTSYGFYLRNWYWNNKMAEIS